MDPMTENSYRMAKDNAEFYREQLEMLREDVEAQNARISQHYEEKASPNRDFFICIFHSGSRKTIMIENACLHLLIIGQK